MVVSLTASGVSLEHRIEGTHCPRDGRHQGIGHATAARHQQPHEVGMVSSGRYLHGKSRFAVLDVWVRSGLQQHSGNGLFAVHGHVKGGASVGRLLIERHLCRNGGLH